MGIPQRELWLHQNPAAKAMVEAGLAELARREIVSIDLSELLEDEDDGADPFGLAA